MKEKLSILLLMVLLCIIIFPFTIQISKAAEIQLEEYGIKVADDLRTWRSESI